MSDEYQHMLEKAIQPLLASGDEALCYFTKRDILDQTVDPIEALWDFPEPKKLLKKQRVDGSWAYPGKYPEKYPDVNYRLIETFKRLRLLVSKYGFNRSHPSIEKAAEYVLSCQTGEGDIRGIYANQYHPHYNGVILELLIKAGYQDDSRVKICLEWLLSVRMEDGGWAPPMLVDGYTWDEMSELSTTYAPAIPFDKSQVSGNMVTGMTLRAFACHPEYRSKDEPREAGKLLASRFFKANVYNTYKAAANWTKFQYPYWWNNLLAALDSLSLMGLSKDNADIKKGLNWFINNQLPDGLWPLDVSKKQHQLTPKATNEQLWVALAICRMLRRFYE